MTPAPDVLFPTSEAEAAAAFGDGDGGDGRRRRHDRRARDHARPALAPAKAIVLTRAGLSGVTRDGSRVTIGAATPVAELTGLCRPRSGRAPSNVADTEIRGAGARSAATSAPAPARTLRAAISRARCSRSARPFARPAPAARRSEPLEDFLAAATAGCCSTSRSTSPQPARSRRSTARTRTTTRRSPCRAHGRRRHRPPRRDRARGARPAAPRRETAADPEAAGTAASTTSSCTTMRSHPPGTGARRCPCSSVVSSPSSRRPHEPHRQRRHPRRSRAAPLDEPARRPARGARDHEPEGGVRAGWLRCVHRARRRRAAPRVSHAGRQPSTAPRSRPWRGSAHRRAPPGPAGVHAPLRRAVRLLHVGDDDRRHAYIDGGGDDDHDAIKDALAGHVCRCTGYVKIIDAVAAAARGDSFDLTVTAAERRHDEPRRCPVKAVGARLPRYDGIEHVTGRTVFVDDVQVPGALWVKALRSPVHSADITKLDTSKAAAMKGVHAVVTWEDVPLLEYGHLSALGIPADEPLLAKDEVRYKGQPIAVVAAEDEDDGAAAVDAIDLELSEERRRCSTSAARSTPTRPTIHQWGNWYPHFEAEMDRRQIRKGDIDARVRRRRRDRAGRLPAGGDRARAARDAGRARSCPRRTAGSRSTPARRRCTSRSVSSPRTCSSRSTS